MDAIRLRRGRNGCTVIRLKREGMDALLLD